MAWTSSRFAPSLFLMIRPVHDVPPQHHPDEPLTLHTAAADIAHSTIPRLISVVEILKREYLSALDADASPGPLTGLHQYNELRWERRDEVPDGGDDRAGSIVKALEGKN